MGWKATTIYGIDIDIDIYFVYGHFTFICRQKGGILEIDFCGNYN